MAKYEPKHLKQKPKRKEVVRIRGNRKGLGFILVTSIFITFVMFSTIYSIFIYPSTLPNVDVMRMSGTNQSTAPISAYSFPSKAIQYDEQQGKHYCYYVTEEIGGWGYRYFIQRKEVIHSGNQANHHDTSVFLIGGHDNFFYVVSDISCLSQGDEVTIANIVR